jgi:hypothetical protein
MIFLRKTDVSMLDLLVIKLLITEELVVQALRLASLDRYGCFCCWHNAERQSLAARVPLLVQHAVTCVCKGMTYFL